MRFLTLTALMLLAGALHVTRAEPTAPLPRDARIPGGVAVLALPAGYRQGDVVRYRGRRVLVVDLPDGPKAVVGIPLSATPGLTSAVWEGAAGATRLAFTVTAHDYPAQRITIADPEKVTPSGANLARIQREQAEILAAFRTRSERTPQLPLVLPVQGPLSSNFGLRRFINGQPRSPHSGIDVAAGTGTPVRAPADGRVLRVGDYFFTGHTVFLDHGGGLVTLYCHLSRVDVGQGDELTAGTVLGAVGATGRATGPHLHWAVSLNDARVDPRLLMAPAGEP